jgi:CMP-N-acetylneuraminic acid synthetase
LVAWTIEHAQKARCIHRTVLSTDGPEIAKIGRDHGVEVVMRPPELANDTATIDSAARHAVQSAEKSATQPYDAVVVLYGNVPLRPSGLIDQAVAKLEAAGADSVQSVCPVGKFHPYWMRRLGGGNGDELQHYQSNNVHRRQDLPPVYQLDGGVIAVTRKSLFTTVKGHPHLFLGKDRRAVVTEPGQVVDVDTPLDFVVAEALVAQGNGLSDECTTGERG